MSARPAPSYVEYGSRVSAPPPVHCRQGCLLGVLLKGDDAKIKDLCRRTLSVPTGCDVEYEPLTDYVLMLAGSFGGVSSMARGFNKWGSVREAQLSLWVPLAAGQREASGFVVDRFCLSVPYMFVDNPLSYAGGREVYGYPKAMGRFSPSGGLGDRVQLEAFGGAFGPSNQAGWAPLVELAQVHPRGAAPKVAATAGAAKADTDADAETWRGADELVAHLVKASGEREPPFLALGVALKQLVEEVLNGRASQVFLKQVRDSEIAGEACYQEIVEARVQVTKTSFRRAFKEWRVTINPLDSHPIETDLGIKNQTTRLTFELMFDMTIQPGVVLPP